MARRRGMGFGAYATRRWRLVGLILVTMAGTVLFAALTDRGHEPEWRADPGDVAALAFSADGRSVLAVRVVASTVRALEGYDAETGDLLWSRPVNLTGPDVLVAVGRDWFAVATGFPDAQLVAVHARGNNLLYHELLDGEPRALAADGDRLAIALRPDRVIEYEGFAPTAVHRVQLPSALAVRGDRVAVGTRGGDVIVIEGDEEVVNVTRRGVVQSLRMSADGTRVAVALATPDLRGVVEYYDLASTQPAVPEWSRPMAAPTVIAGLTRDGSRVLAFEETPRLALTLLAAQGGDVVWSRRVEGPIARDETGRAGGAAVAPDGSTVSYVTLDGDHVLLDAATGEVRWTHRAEGGTAVAYGASADRVAANARLVAKRGYDALLVFRPDAEPAWARFPQFALALAAAEGVLGLAGLAGAWAWYRRL